MTNSPRGTSGSSLPNVLLYASLLILVAAVFWRVVLGTGDAQGLKLPDEGYLLDLPDSTLATLGVTRQGDSPLLVLCISATCRVCPELAPQWRLLQSLVRDSEPPMQLLGMSINSQGLTDLFMRQHELSFPVIADSTREIFKQNRIGVSPAVIFVGTDGRVQWAMPGQSGTARILDELSRPKREG